MKALIIDDEASARNMMKILLERHVPSVAEIFMASGAQQGIEMIHEHDPEVVFLDVEMPHMNGFDMLCQLEKWNFDIIFTTAYSQYAIQAIKFSALDYLLKPISVDDLQTAIHKFLVKKSENDIIRDKFRNFVHNLQTQSVQNFRLVINSTQSTEFISVSDIICCMADSNYTQFILTGGKRVIVSKTLKEYETLLSDKDFCRVHKSWLVNLRHVSYVEAGNVLVLSDESRIEIARRKKDEVLHALTMLKQ